MQIRLAQTEEDIKRCFPAILALRPHLQETGILPLLTQIQGENGYLVMAEEGDAVPAIAVFRINHYLLHGKDLYIDDLSTLEGYRRRGYGQALLAWIKNFAVEQGCNTLRLDSGHTRFDAHRLYLNFGFHIKAHHFTLLLS